MSTFSRARGRPPRGEERRLQILEAFERCLARQGLEATTLDDVAREAGVQRVMIRHYVGNRDTLIREATEHLAAQYRSRAARALDEAGDALDADALLDFFFLGDFAAGMPEQDRVADSLLAAAVSDPEVRGPLRAMYESFDELVRKHLTRCVPGAESDRLAEVSWAIVCLAEQNTIMLGLGVPPRRAQELRKIARVLVDSLH
jgi:AcrR family transcriptional regulator